MEFTITITEIFQIKEKGTVLGGKLDNLNETCCKDKAQKELDKFIKKGDIVLIDSQELVVQQAERISILTYPIIYGKTIYLLFEKLPYENNFYKNKELYFNV